MLGLAFLLMLVTFRSIVIPIKAIVLNLLSVGAAYGVLVLVFQKGNGESLLGFTSNGGVTNWLPLFLFVVLFGLSMDYHVFILSRVKELYDRGMSTDEAVQRGIATTAGTVTSAAIVMVGVFLVFVTLTFIDFKELGLGLAAAVLIDATVIRGVLLPASMKVLGDWNWYLPSWLEWLPHVGSRARRRATTVKGRSSTDAAVPRGRAGLRADMEAMTKDVAAAASAAPVVALRDVRKVHGQGDGAVVALDGVSAGLSPGSFTAIMGPSGSGKSTFLHVAAGLDRPTSGTVALGGHRAGGAQRAQADDPEARAGRVRLPGLQPDAVAHGHPEHRPAAAPGRSPRAALGGARGRGAGRAGPAPAPPSLRALRRPAAAGRDRPGARHPAGGGVRRRADRSAGQPDRAWGARATARGRRRGRPHGRDGHA